MAGLREWRPDPTGRYPFREWRVAGWGDLVATTVDGAGMAADLEGGRLARGAAPAPPERQRRGRAALGAAACLVAATGLAGVGWWVTRDDVDIDPGDREMADEVWAEQSDLEREVACEQMDSASGRLIVVRLIQDELVEAQVDDAMAQAIDGDAGQLGEIIGDGDQMAEDRAMAIVEYLRTRC